MRKKIRLLVMMLVTLLVGGIMTFSVAEVSAAKCPAGSARGEGATVGSLAECNTEKTKGDKSLMKSIRTIISVALGVLGVAAVIAIIIGGIQFVTSNGDAAKVKKAKDAILYGVIGLVVALLAFAIVSFVLGDIFGVGKSSDEYSSNNSSNDDDDDEEINPGDPSEKDYYADEDGE